MEFFNRNKRKFVLGLKLSLGMIACLYVMMIGLSFININPYKERIQQWLLEKTGQAFILEGPISLSAFPYLTLEAEQLYVKEKSSPSKNLLTVEKLKLKLNPSSLFPGRTSISAHLFGVHIKNHTIFEIKTKILIKKELLEFNKNKIKFHKKHSRFIEFDHCEINTAGPEPIFHARHQSTDFALDLILLTFMPENRIEGKTAFSCELKAEGDTLNKIQHSLEGQLHIEMSHGRIYGLDLIASLKEAKSFVTFISSSVGRNLGSALEKIIAKKSKVLSEQTPFEKLKFTANIEKGVLNNHHLSVNHAKYDLKGNGYLNLDHQTLDYQLEARYQENIQTKLSKVLTHPLILRISGPVKAPKIRADMESYFRYVRGKK